MYQRMTKLLLAGVVAALFAVIGTSGAHAASVMVDVCHIEGNGSFALLNISDKAMPAHLRHGDALPGEGVPFEPEFEFDDNCEQVLASSCPCDFSATGLAQIGIDGTENEVCQSFGLVIVQIYDDEFPTFANVRSDAVCVRAGTNFPGPGPTDFETGLTSGEIDDCIFDLQQSPACEVP